MMKPTRKVSAGAIASAASIVLVWALTQIGADVPPEVASAITTLMSVAAAWAIREA